MALKESLKRAKQNKKIFENMLDPPLENVVSCSHCVWQWLIIATDFFSVKPSFLDTISMLCC